MSAFNIEVFTFLILSASWRKIYYSYLSGTIRSESCVSHWAVSYMYLLNDITILKFTTIYNILYHFIVETNNVVCKDASAF